MRCRRCDYRLWNLRSRRCPECGTAFVPSEYEFAPSSVRFCCPHCDQAYYGDGAKGHLDPVEFDCVTCGAHIHMDDMVLRPSEGVDEAQTEVERLPWLHRKGRGAVRAWLSTVGMALVQPMRLMRLVPIESSVASAVWFAVLTNLLVLFVCAIPTALFMAGMAFGMAGSGLSMAAGVGVAFLFLLFVVMIFVLLWGLACHGLLRVTGATQGGLGRTFQAVCYAAGANAPTAVPCLGIYFGWIWWLVSAVLMVKEGQRVHGGRAAFAVLTPPVTVLAVLVGWNVWLLLSVLPRAATMASMGSGTQGETQLVVDAIAAFAEGHNGSSPKHAIQLVDEEYLGAYDLVTWDSDTEPADVPIGDVTLERFEEFGPAKRRAVFRTAVDALPANVVAHRVGDFVFTFHGVNLRTADPGIWTVICWPEASAATQVSPNRLVHIGRADGTVFVIPAGGLQESLKHQNTLRAQQGLPPLPDPATVTHESPAVHADD